MVASDGGIFAFGDAKFHGSMGGAHLNQPVNGLVPTADNRGYWLVCLRRRHLRLRRRARSTARWVAPTSTGRSSAWCGTATAT